MRTAHDVHRPGCQHSLPASAWQLLHICIAGTACDHEQALGGVAGWSYRAYVAANVVGLFHHGRLAEVSLQCQFLPQPLSWPSTQHDINLVSWVLSKAVLRLCRPMSVPNHVL